MQDPITRRARMTRSAPDAHRTLLTRLEYLESRVLLTAADYSLAFTSLTLPDAVSGFIDKGTAKVTLTNDSNAAFTSADKADIRIVVRPVGALDSSTDIEIGKLLNQGIGIAVGVSKTFTLPLTVPADAPLGDFNVFVFANQPATAGGAELAVTTAADDFTVQPQVLDLHTTFGAFTLPSSVISGAGGSAKIPVKVTNDGNIVTASTEKVRIQIVARPVGGGSDIVLTTLDNQAIGGLKPGKFKMFSVTTQCPITVGTGDFDVTAIVTDLGPTAEANPDNNTAVGPTVSVIQGVLDLGATFGAGTHPPATIVSGFGTIIPVQVVVTNDGNIAGTKTQKVTIEIVAHPVSGGADVPLKTLTGLSIAGLKPGLSKTFATTLTLPVALDTQQWEITAIVTDLGPTPESVPENNTASTTPMDVTQGFVDLATTFGNVTVPPAIIAGTTVNGSVQVKVTNAGNISTAAAEKADITLVLRPEGGGADIPLKTLTAQAVGNLKPGSFKLFTVPVTLAGSLTQGVYNIVATTTDTTPGADTNAANDSATLADAQTIAAPFVDLAVDSAATTLSGTVIGGTAGLANVMVKNLANVASVGYLVEIFATDNGTIADGAAPIGSLSSSTVKINPGATLKVPVNFTVPSVASNTPLTLVARVTLAGDTTEPNNTGNLAAITAATPPAILGNEPSQITFTETQFLAGPPPVNLTVSAGTVTYAGQVSGGDTFSYTTTTAPTQGKIASLGLGISPFGPLEVRLTFTGARPLSLNGRTITFQSSSAGATGSFAVLASFPFAGIPVPISGFFVLS